MFLLLPFTREQEPSTHCGCPGYHYFAFEAHFPEAQHFKILFGTSFPQSEASNAVITRTDNVLSALSVSHRSASEMWFLYCFLKHPLYLLNDDVKGNECNFLCCCISGLKEAMGASAGQWVYVSDAHVQVVPESRVLNAQAYLLFYERLLI